jgi:glycerol kinase
MIKMSRRLVGAIDQGTTSTRFLLFDQSGRLVAKHQEEFASTYPHAGCELSRRPR